jgi:hypothetical protein
MFAPGCAAHECRLGLGKREDRIDLGPQPVSASRANSSSCSWLGSTTM